MKTEGTYQVSPWDVKIHPEDDPARSDINHQMLRLEDEGQIEPVVVDYMTKEVVTGEPGWTYAPAQVVAARELNWPTILVTFLYP